jgi:hypothetical protein
MGKFLMAVSIDRFEPAYIWKLVAIFMSRNKCPEAQSAIRVFAKVTTSALHTVHVASARCNSETTQANNSW